MANECMNYITIKGDKDLLQIFADSYLEKIKAKDYELDFNIIAPIPEDCDNDYDFRIQNWGNKWDGTNGYVSFHLDSKEPEIFLDVATAWGPCLPITIKLIELCPALYFYHEYYEPGMGFCGYIEHFAEDSPDYYIEKEYSVDYDPREYWIFMFDKEFENFDWLYDYVNEMVDDKELSSEDGALIHSMIEHDSIENIVDYCIRKGVL